MSITTSLWNVWRYSHASLATFTQASGSSPLTWKIGAWMVLATSEQYNDERAYCGAVVKPIWLLMIRWTAPPMRYPPMSLIANPSATMPWPAKAASPWMSTGSTVNPPGRLDLVLLGAHHAEHDRPDGLEVARVGGELHRDRGARRTDVLALHPEVVLHVARPLHRVGVDVALELGEDRLVALTDDVRQHVEPATVGHAERDAVEPGIRRVREDLVEDRDRRLGTLDAEPLRTDVLRGEELLERLGRVQALEDPVLLFLRRRLLPRLDLVLDPDLLVGVLDVHVLHTDGATVGIAKHTEQVAEAHLVDAADPVGEELPVEVPDREAVRRGVELARRVWLLPTQRVEVGDQVAADAVHTDELGDGHLLAEHRLFVVDRVRVRPPLDRFVGHPERMEDVVVEPVLAEQQFVHALQERSRFGTLDDPVVVRAGDRDDLADAERAEVATVGSLELGRVVDAADPDDHALPGHQPGHRLDGADRAGVGERDVGALEVLDRRACCS